MAVAGEQKPQIQASPASIKDVNTSSDMALGTTVPVGVPAKLVSPAVSPGVTTVLELKNSSNLNLTGATKVQKPSAVLPPETWLQVRPNIRVMLSCTFVSYNFSTVLHGV